MAERAPAELAWLADVIGATALMCLIEARAGTRVYIPRGAAPDGKLSQIIGVEAAHRAAAAWGGDTITVPVARAWRARQYRAAGLSWAAIAHRLGCHEDTVWRLLRPRSSAEQLPLPL